jgi:hypothetical protein
MLRGYNLVPWEKITLSIKDANQLFRVCTYGWKLQAYFFTLKICPQKQNWNEFINKFKLLPIGVQKMIL